MSDRFEIIGKVRVDDEGRKSGTSILIEAGSNDSPYKEKQ